MELREKVEKTKKYAEAFWQHEMIDRPYVAVMALTAPSKYRCNQAMTYRVCMNEDYDSIIDPFIEHNEKVYFGGEALPRLNITCGPDQFGAFFGGQIQCDDLNGTTWVPAFLKELEDFQPYIDKSENGYFNKLKKFYEYAAAKGEGKFLIDVLDMHSNMDAVSAMRGTIETCYDLYDSPEEIHRIMKVIRESYREVFDMVYQAGKMEQRGTIGWSPIYCEGKSAVLQCDFSCTLSPELGREFVFPAIREEAEYLDHSVYHLDGKEALVHLDTILEIDRIDCIQWVPGAGQPKTYKWMDVLKKIQAAGKAVWIYDWTAEEVKAYHKELEPDKVAYSLNVKSQAEGEALLEYLVKNT